MEHDFKVGDKFRRTRTNFLLYGFDGGRFDVGFEGVVSEIGDVYVLDEKHSLHHMAAIEHVDHSEDGE